MTIEQAHDFIFDKLGFCGCGDPYSVLETVKKVLSLMKERGDAAATGSISEQVIDIIKIVNGEKVKPDTWKLKTIEINEILMQESRPDLYYMFMYTLDHAGLTEHGTSVGGCWLTKTGEEFLNALNANDVEKIIDLNA